MSRTPWRLVLIAGVFVAGFALVAAACGNDDDSNGATSPTAQGTGNGTASPTMEADGNGAGADLEQRYNELKDQFDQASQDSQQQLQDLRDQMEEKYKEWETATADERDKLAQEFNDLADQLKNALDEAG